MTQNYSQSQPHQTLQTALSRPSTQQEQFWEGEFGNVYTERNDIKAQDRAPFFQRILDLAPGIQTVCELGANRGHNLQALHMMNPDLSLTGVELNEAACKHLAQQSGIQAVHSAIQDFSPNSQFDLVFTCGVLIHLNPEDLPSVYDKMASLSSRYILVNEYYNPTPVELSYRGHSEKLFKRDFGGELMDRRPNTLRLMDYGFLWKRVSPAWDNTTWWLFEKQR